MMLTSADVLEKWQEIKAKEPRARTVDIAKKLEISEGELLRSAVGNGVIELTNDWSELFSGISTLGRVMGLTRNKYAVHERKGTYPKASFFHGMQMGQLVDPDIDLRLFPGNWKRAFALSEVKDLGLRPSIHLYNNEGQAVHKVILLEESNWENWEKFCQTHRLNETGSGTVFETEKFSNENGEKKVEATADEVRKAWSELKDTHDFFGLLSRFKLSRREAFVLAGEKFAQKVETSTVENLLRAVSAGNTTFMVFVGNRGLLQIHTGKAINIVELEDWINVMDEAFNLHLMRSAIQEAWVIRKPTRDGQVTSLEVFDKDGNDMVTFFGPRKPGQAEDQEWRKVLGEVTGVPVCVE